MEAQGQGWDWNVFLAGGPVPVSHDSDFLISNNNALLINYSPETTIHNRVDHVRWQGVKTSVMSASPTWRK